MSLNSKKKSTEELEKKREEAEVEVLLLRTEILTTTIKTTTITNLKRHLWILNLQISFTLAVVREARLALPDSPKTCTSDGMGLAAVNASRFQLWSACKG